MSILTQRNKSGLLCYWDDVANASPRKSRLEKVEQKDLNAFCTKRWPEESLMMYHVVNESGASGDARYGAELNQMGRKKGVPDWPVMIPSNGYHGLYIELKRSRKKDSSITKESKSFAATAEKYGYKVVYAYGYCAALQAISDYLN